MLVLQSMIRLWREAGRQSQAGKNSLIFASN